MNADPKRFSSLQARAALLGVELRAVRTDLEHWSFIATSGAATAELSTLEEVEQLLRELTSPSAEGTNA